MKINTKSMVLVAMFAALTAVGAFINIPIPYVPFTMQFFFCAMAGVILGAKLGALSQIVYVLIGLFGVPVFTKGGGVGYVFQPTFGFLLGLIASAFVIGLIVEKVKFKPFITYLGAILCGLIVLYLFGIPYLYLILNVYMQTTMGIITVISKFAIPYLGGDIVKSITVAFLCTLIIPKLKSLYNTL